MYTIPGETGLKPVGKSYPQSYSLIGEISDIFLEQPFDNPTLEKAAKQVTPFFHRHQQSLVTLEGDRWFGASYFKYSSSKVIVLFPYKEDSQKASLSVLVHSSLDDELVAEVLSKERDSLYNIANPRTLIGRLDHAKRRLMGYLGKSS